jgi:hypothetical protein
MGREFTQIFANEEIKRLLNLFDLNQRPFAPICGSSLCLKCRFSTPDIR